MTVLFYNHLTAMVGIDMHPCWRDAPSPHAVAGVHIQSTEAEGLSRSVFFDGKRVVQEGHNITPVPHAALDQPLTAAEEAAGFVRMAMSTAFGTSKAFVPRRSVHVNGKPAACATRGSTGCNLDCNTPIKVPSGITTTWGTVVTSLSAADVAAAVATFLFEIPFSLINNWSRDLLRDLPERALRPYLPWLQKMFEKLAVDPAKKAIKRLTDLDDRAAELGERLGETIHVHLD